MQGHGRISTAQHHPKDELADAFQRPTAAEDLQLFDRLPAREGRDQPCQAQDVVEVTVGDQDAVEALEAQARLEDLALGALAAVDQEAVLVVDDHLGGEAAPDGGGRSGGAEEDDFEQEGNPSVRDKQFYLIKQA